MGWFWGEDKTMAPEASNNATLNSSVTIGNTVDVTSQEILLLLSIIAAVKIIELMLHLYRTLARNMKKKYVNRNDPEIKL